MDSPVKKIVELSPKKTQTKIDDLRAYVKALGLETKSTSKQELFDKIIDDLGKKAVEEDPAFAKFKKLFEENKLRQEDGADESILEFVRTHLEGVVSPATGGKTERTVVDIYVDAAEALAKRSLFKTPTKTPHPLLEEEEKNPGSLSKQFQEAEEIGKKEAEKEMKTSTAEPKGKAKSKTSSKKAGASKLSTEKKLSESKQFAEAVKHGEEQAKQEVKKKLFEESKSEGRSNGGQMRLVFWAVTAGVFGIAWIYLR